MIPTIAGIAIPDSALAREATEFVRDTTTQLLFDHSRRVFLWASLQADRLNLERDAELLYVGALFHDLGLVEGHRSAHERFEIDVQPEVRLVALGVSYGVRDKPETATGMFLTDVLEETVPGYVRPNSCDFMRNTPFET
jgi:hypothetical protein